MQDGGETARLGRMAVAAGKTGRSLHHMPVDILDHDDAGIDDQPEVERANRKQIRGLPLQGQDQHRKGERERNGDGNDDRAAQIAQEQPIAGRR